MARNGSGTYVLPSGNPVVTNTTIASTVQNTTMSDVANELTNSIARDGQSPPTANLPMGNFRHTGVSAAAARTDYARYDQVQDNAATWGGVAGGTADALTIGPSVAVTALTAGQRFEFISGASANTTTTPTLTVSAQTAKTIVSRTGGALSIGSIRPSTVYTVLYDGTSFRLMAVDGQFLIDASGRALNPANTQIAFNYYRGSSQVSGNTILFDTASFTQQGSGYAAGTGLFTAPVTGLYLLNFCVQLNVGTSGGSGIGQFQWYLNSVALSDNIAYATYSQPGVGFIYVQANSTFLSRLAAGDTIGVRRTDNTFSATRPGYGYFNGYLLG